MTSLRQLLLPGISARSRSRRELGGDIGRGKRKQSRPFSGRLPLHLVLRSSRARGPWSLRRRPHEAAIAEELERAARRFNVKIYERATVENHIHLLVRARSRESLSNFLRFVGGRIAQRVTGALKGQPCQRFWDELAWSRIVTWGPDFRNVIAYIQLNLCETMGLVPQRPRRRTPCSPDRSATQLQ